MSAKIVNDCGALVIFPDDDTEIWVQPTSADSLTAFPDGNDTEMWVAPLPDRFEMGIHDGESVAYVTISRKELKAFRKAINRALDR